MNSRKTRDLPTPASPDEGHDLAASRERLRRRAPEGLDLELPADEFRHRARGERVDAHAGVHALEPGDLHRVLDPLERVGAHRAHPDESLGERHGVAAEQDAAGPGERLEPRRDVGRHPVHADLARLPGLVPHRDDDRTGVDPDADLQWQADVARHLVRAHADRLLHVERRIARHHRMIFQSERRTEARHDPVAAVADDDPLVPVHRVRHELDGRCEQAPRLLGIEVPDDLGGVRDVSEQDGGDLALGVRGCDPAREMLRGLDLGQDGPRGAERLAAGAAELLPGAQRGPATRAALVQIRAAVLAETRLRIVREPALPARVGPALRHRSALSQRHSFRADCGPNRMRAPSGPADARSDLRLARTADPAGRARRGRGAPPPRQAS